MSTMELQSLALPAETICHVLSFVTPQELISLQKVSKQFYAIVNDPAVWRTAYANARLPRPPGPFASQTARFLQCTLVHSARLAESWTSRPTTANSLCRISLREPADTCQWLCGRWLILGEAMKRIVSYDVDTDTRQVLWDCGLISWWTVLSIICARGCLIYVALCIKNGDREYPVRLLEFLADYDSGQLSGPVTLDVPLRYPEGVSYVDVNGSNDSPLIQISFGNPVTPEHTVLFDTRSRVFYKFPKFYSKLDPEQLFPGSWFPHSTAIELTTTHVIVMSKMVLSLGNDAKGQLIQAFTIPDNACTGDNSICELRLSNETILTGIRLRLRLIRNSVICPRTGTTSMRFMHMYTHRFPFRIHFVGMDFTLPRSDTNDVLPMSSSSHEILTIEGLHERHWIDASHDGFVRGVCYMCRSHEICNFTIDVASDRCVAVAGPPGPAVNTGRLVSFDGFRGRVCLAEEGGNQDVDKYAVVVLDLK